MGAFNTLVAKTACPVCKVTSVFELQFKFGNTWQYNYKIGENLKWGGNDIGIPGLSKVLVEAIGGPCSNCRTNYLEFDILIEDDVIIKVQGVGIKRQSFNPNGFVIVSK